MIQLSNLKTIPAMVVVFSILCLICPGLMILFIFDNESFKLMETLKIILISVSISSPFFIISFITGTIIYEIISAEEKIEKEGDKERLSQEHTLSAILLTNMLNSVTWILVSLFLLFTYFFYSKFSVYQISCFIVTAFITISLIILILFIWHKSSER